jgi:hypothetical protein
VDDAGMPNLDLFFSTTLFLTEKADAQNKKSRAFFFAAGHPLGRSLWSRKTKTKNGRKIQISILFLGKTVPYD